MNHCEIGLNGTESWHNVDNTIGWLYHNLYIAKEMPEHIS